jgi:hypothetical protein
MNSMGFFIKNAKTIIVIIIIIIIIIKITIIIMGEKYCFDS